MLEVLEKKVILGIKICKKANERRCLTKVCFIESDFLKM